MFRITTDDNTFFIGLFLEGLFSGLYTAIFTMYLQYHASKKGTNKTQKIIFYSISALYVSSVAVFVCDITEAIVELQFGYRPASTLLRLHFIQTTSFGCSDFIAQFILIYRCWIVWGRNIPVVIIPSVLAFAFLATWLAFSDSGYSSSYQPVDPGWGKPVLLTSLAMSLTVNALVTGLIVLRILKVFRQVKATSDGQILGATGGIKLQRVIFILIESGMALFLIQLVRLVATIVWPTEIAIRVLNIVSGIHEMLNGIAPTIIVVRTSMGLSFDDEKSMEEVATESLCFAPNHPNSVLEAGSINIVDQDSDDIGIQRSNDIDDAER